jgi:nitrogen fixation protein NifB
LHLGEADSFQIWGPEGQGFRLLEERPAPPPGSGGNRWWEMAEILKDCRAVLVSALGETPEAILTEAGVVPVAMSGFIEVGLSRIYSGEPLTSLKGRRGGLTRACSGKGLGKGCM